MSAPNKADQLVMEVWAMSAHASREDIMNRIEAVFAPLPREGQEQLWVEARDADSAFRASSAWESAPDNQKNTFEALYDYLRSLSTRARR